MFHYPVTDPKGVIDLFQYLDASEIMENVDPITPDSSVSKIDLVWVPTIESK